MSSVSVWLKHSGVIRNVGWVPSSALPLTSCDLEEGAEFQRGRLTYRLGSQLRPSDKAPGPTTPRSAMLTRW